MLVMTGLTGALTVTVQNIRDNFVTGTQVFLSPIQYCFFRKSFYLAKAYFSRMALVICRYCFNKRKFTGSSPASAAIMLRASLVSIIKLDNMGYYGMAIVTFFHDLLHFVFHQKSCIVGNTNSSFETQGRDTNF